MNTQQIAEKIQAIVADCYALGYEDITGVYDHPYFIDRHGLPVMRAFEQSLRQSPELYDMVQTALRQDQ